MYRVLRWNGYRYELIAEFSAAHVKPGQSPELYVQIMWRDSRHWNQWKVRR